MVDDLVARIETEIERLKGQVGSMQDRVDLAALKRHRDPEEKEFRAALTELTDTLAKLNQLTEQLDELLSNDSS